VLAVTVRLGPGRRTAGPLSRIAPRIWGGLRSGLPGAKPTAPSIPGLLANNESWDM
jgi:hypothetical protein